MKRNGRTIIGWTRHEGRVTTPIPYSDVHGIPQFRYLDESEQERHARETLASEAGQRALEELFYRLSGNLGVERAKALFRHASTRPAHRPKGGSRQDRDLEMIAAYYDAADTAQDVKMVPRAVARKLLAMNPKRYGNSAEAIEKHIRRLVGRREATLKWGIKSLEEAQDSVIQNETRPRNEDKKPGS